jgi:hypothetical protein
MRLSAVLPVLLALASPAPAADSIADQAERAYGVFAGGQSEVDYLSAKYGATLLKDVTGNWVSLNGPAPQTGVETYGADTEKSCKGAGTLTLASPNLLTLTLTAKPSTSEFSQTYTLIAGSVFAEHTDPASYFAAIGLGPDKVGPQFEQPRALALSLANGIVQIYRPSEDILVMTRDKAYPTILARCPNV